MKGVEQMTATADPAAKQMARFVVMYDTPPTSTRSNVNTAMSTSRWRNSIRACVVTRAVMSRQP
jgi:hypothetical protein